jgi:transcription elongation factor GreA-like protein
MIMLNKGTVVLDEVVCHIQDIYLKDGKLWFKAMTDDHTTCTVMEDADISVFDPEGNLVFHAPSMGIGKVHPVRDGRLYVDFPCVIGEVVERSKP